MYALIEYKGKQYKAEKGTVLTVDKLSEEKGSTVKLDSVLLVSDGNKISVGDTPMNILITGANGQVGRELVARLQEDRKRHV